MDRPDIIFIVLDTQRADRLGTYGYDATLTPHLDRWAEEGAVFEQAIAPAQWTIPSHASMFTGRYPTAHQVLQSNKALTPDLPHLAELLRGAGYDTVGFCNNPLVGILNNGFKRGFNRFYNYGGAFPSLPEQSSALPWPLNHLVASYTQFLRRISYPIQNFFGRSDLAFRLSLNAWLTPLWSRFANFKGQNERSVGDIVTFLQQREQRSVRQPLFLFVNLMETHLPFSPPQPFIDRVAPYFRRDREAREILRRWNREAYRWAAPLAEPLGKLEAQVLSDLYDAEVTYQDDYLGRLFDTLRERRTRDDTLTVIVGDHGDGLGEHGHMGHAFVAYQELVHVPLLLHWPRRVMAHTRETTPVSTRRVFHTIVEAAGRMPEAASKVSPAEVRSLSFLETLLGRDPEQGRAYAEVYPPLNFVRAIERRQPELLERFRCLSLRRALVHGTDKLIMLDGEADELFRLDEDPHELHDLRNGQPERAQQMTEQLERAVASLERQRLSLAAGATLDLEADEGLLQQLRALGYID